VPAGFGMTSMGWGIGVGQRMHRSFQSGCLMNDHFRVGPKPCSGFSVVMNNGCVARWSWNVKVCGFVPIAR
jgi:hypothetical protein